MGLNRSLGIGFGLWPLTLVYNQIVTPRAGFKKHLRNTA
jgi:hypothetical protein